MCRIIAATRGWLVSRKMTSSSHSSEGERRKKKEEKGVRVCERVLSTPYFRVSLPNESLAFSHAIKCRFTRMYIRVFGTHTNATAVAEKNGARLKISDTRQQKRRIHFVPPMFRSSSDIPGRFPCRKLWTFPTLVPNSAEHLHSQTICRHKFSLIFLHAFSKLKLNFPPGCFVLFVFRFLLSTLDARALFSFLRCAVCCAMPLSPRSHACHPYASSPCLCIYNCVGTRIMPDESDCPRTVNTLCASTRHINYVANTYAYRLCVIF